MKQQKTIIIILVLIASGLLMWKFGFTKEGMYSCTPLASSLGYCNPSESLLVKCTRGLGGEILEQIDEDVCPGELERAAYYCLYGYGGNYVQGYWAFTSGCGTYTCSGSYVFDGSTYWLWKCDAVTIPPPPKFEPTFSGIISKILDWLRSLFNWLVSYQIVGTSQPPVGSIQTYDISLSAVSPDSDYSDGSYQLQYGGWALLDNSNKIIQEGNWREINGNYIEKVTLTIPSQPSNYALVAVIYQYDMQYNSVTNTWEIVKEEVVTREAFDIRTTPPTPIKPTPSFGDILSKIWTWLSDFFKGIFG